MRKLKTQVSLLLVAMLAVMLFTNCITASAEEKPQDANSYNREANECYENGDYEAAFENYQKAAELGNVNAWYYMGVFYANGLAVKQDYTSALLWYQKAADAGDARAMCNIGYLYQMGYVGGGS